MSQNLYTNAFSQNYYLSDQESFLNDPKKADLTKVLSFVLDTSDAHDQAVKQRLKVTDYVISDDQTWVITKNRIVIHQWPEINQEIKISTFVMEANRFFITRQYLVEADGDLLMTLFIQFAAIDFTTRKMVRLNYQSLPDLFDLEAKIKMNFSRLSLPEEADLLFNQTIEILPTDIDFNEHVNNLVYVRWAYRALMERSLINHLKLTTLEIKFGNEALLGQSLELYSYQIEEKEFVQTDQIIYNKTLDKEACHLRMTWKKEKNS